MAHKSITWDIAVGGTVYNRRDGVLPGDTMKVPEEITEEQAKLRVAYKQAHWAGDEPPNAGPPDMSVLGPLLKEMAEHNAASAESVVGQ